jgi:zinc protease
MVLAGATSDPPGKEGLAHLTEHLIFQAPREGGMSAHEFYDGSGVEVQGETSPDATRFAVTVHRERFAELLKFELARMSDPLSSLDSAKVRRELHILREEDASQHPRWRQEAMNSLFRALFPGGSSLIREPGNESINGLTLDDARQFVEAHYQPASMQLFIVGDFSWAQAEEILGKVNTVTKSSAGNLERKLASTSSPPPGRPINKMIQHQGFVAENVLHIGWPLPPHVDMVGIEPLLVPLVSSVVPRIEGPALGKYPAWLPQGALGEKTISLVSTRQGGVILVSAQLPPKAVPAKIAANIINEVDLLASKIETNPKTFASVQYKVTQSRLRETEDADYRISRLMQQHALGDDRLSRDYFTDLNAVTPREAADFARAWLRKSSARLVLVSPMKAKGAVATPITIASSSSPATDPPVPPLGASPEALFPNGRFVWKKLPSGLEIAVLSRPRSAINTFLLGVRATSRNPDLEPIGPFVEVARGTLLCPASAMACQKSVNATSFRALVSSLGESLLDSARYLLGVAIMPRYDWNAAAKDWLGPLLEKREGMPDAIANRDFQAALWGSHPKGKRVSMDLLRRVSLRDLLQWEDANIRPENTLLIAVTNKDPDQVAVILAGVMQRWRVSPPLPTMPKPSVPDLADTHPLQVSYVADPSLESARFAFGCLMPSLGTFTDRAAAKMVGDWAYRLLFSQLRIQSDASYSTAMQVNAYASGETSMLGTLDVSMDSVGQAVALFRALFDRPRAFDERQLRHMKELRIRRVALQNLTGSDIATEVFDRWSFHMGNPTPLREFEEIRHVTAKQLGAIWDVCRQNAVLQVRTSQPLQSRSER